MDWIVSVSDAERRAGQLSSSSDQAARDALRTFGLVVLRGAFPVEVVESLRSEFERQYGARTHGEMDDLSNLGPPNPVLRVGEGRYEILVRIEGAFGQPNVFGNLLLCRLLVRVLDSTMKLSGMTVVVSYPGAKMQHVHSDHPALFGEPGVSASLPHYAINVAMPLIDVDPQTGPTAFWPGSHLWEPGRAPRVEESVSTDFMRGDCILIDYRTQHAGLPNTSGVARPILYLVYARTWFFDEINHRARPSLDLPEADFLALPPHLQQLMMRAYSQRVRARHLTGAGRP